MHKTPGSLQLRLVFLFTDMVVVVRPVTVGTVFKKNQEKYELEKMVLITGALTVTCLEDVATTPQSTASPQGSTANAENGMRLVFNADHACTQEADIEKTLLATDTNAAGILNERLSTCLLTPNIPTVATLTDIKPHGLTPVTTEAINNGNSNLVAKQDINRDTNVLKLASLPPRTPPRNRYAPERVELVLLTEKSTAREWYTAIQVQITQSRVASLLRASRSGSFHCGAKILLHNNPNNPNNNNNHNNPNK